MTGNDIQTGGGFVENEGDRVVNQCPSQGNPLPFARAQLPAAAAEQQGGKAGLYTPSIAVELPVEHNTPDGMTLCADGNLLVACPNFNTNQEGNEQPVWIMKISRISIGRLRESNWSRSSTWHKP